MALTAGRANALRQLVKAAIDDLEAEYGPAPDITAFHQALGALDAQWAALHQRIFGTGPIALDGDPKPNG